MSLPGSPTSTSGMLNSMMSGSSSSARKSSETYETLPDGVSPQGASSADKANWGKTVGRGFARPKLEDTTSTRKTSSTSITSEPSTPSSQSQGPLLNKAPKKSECCIPCCIL